MEPMGNTTHIGKIKKGEEHLACKAPMSSGPCRHYALPGKDYCSMHQNVYTRTENAKSIYQFRLAQYQARVDELADHPQLRSLTNELAVSRMVLEEIVNKCDNEAKFLAYQPRIHQMLQLVGDLTVKCQRLEQQFGGLLSINEVFQILDAFADIIGKYVTDAAIVRRISEEIGQCLLEQQKERQETITLEGQ